MNTLTYVIASRNDDWASWNHDLTGTPLRRLYNALQCVAQNHPEAEVTVVDWGSQLPLHQAILDYGASRGRSVRARFIYVPPPLAAQYHTPFCEVVALNIGIRRAKTDWIAKLDQDILLGTPFAPWFRGNIPRGAYFSLRRDLAPGDIAPRGNEQPWRGWPLDAPYCTSGSVGLLLAPREAWFHVRGYAENLIYRNNIEHDLCFRFLQNGTLFNLGTEVNACFFHQWHPELPGRPDNVFQPLNANTKIPTPNTDTWGLATATFQETLLGT